jgi:quercetin dioxygenase-like cupin family protein
MHYSLRTSKDAERDTVVQEWGSLNWLAGNKIGNAQGVTVGRVTIKKGQSNPRHSHSNCEEVLYLLEGRLEHSMGDAKVVLGPGDTLVVKAGVPHDAVSIGETDADVIVAYSCGDRDFVPES